MHGHQICQAAPKQDQSEQFGSRQDGCDLAVVRIVMQQEISLDAYHVDGPADQSHSHVRPHPHCQVHHVPVHLSQDEHHDRQMVEIGVFESGGRMLRASLDNLEVYCQQALQEQPESHQCQDDEQRPIEGDGWQAVLQGSRQITRKAPHDYIPIQITPHPSTNNFQLSIIQLNPHHSS